jgi:hypothetical protein
VNESSNNGFFFQLMFFLVYFFGHLPQSELYSVYINSRFFKYCESLYKKKKTQINLVLCIYPLQTHEYIFSISDGRYIIDPQCEAYKSISDCFLIPEGNDSF